MAISTKYYTLVIFVSKVIIAVDNPRLEHCESEFLTLYLYEN